VRALYPSMKEKKRYILFEAVKGKLEHESFSKEFQRTCISFLGDLGISLSHPKAIPKSFRKNFGIVRCQRDYVPHIKVCISLTRNPNLLIQSKKTSGSLKKLMKEI